MKKLQKISPLLGAIIAVTGSAAVSAKSYEVALSGVGASQLTTIQNIPNVPTAPMPGLYQAPAMTGVGGSGIPASLTLSIDGDTGAVTDFATRLTSAGIFSATGTRWSIRSPGYGWTPGVGFGPGACAVTNGGNDGDGTLTYDCPVVQNTSNFANHDPSGNLCGTSSPTATNGDNGCGAAWAGFPTGFSAPAPATKPALAINAGGTFFGDTIAAVGYPHGDIYITADHEQNANGHTMTAYQGKRGGGKFVISHTGTLAGGDFAVTAVEYSHNTDIAFPLQGGITGYAQSVSTYEFNTVDSQSLVLLASDAKNVPAMGAFGLAALFGGLVAVAARLRRRVS